ncbi:prolyl-tRNA synthetase associated domain-containing protein [Chitinophaga qingshengii]|uniref:Prolyl-tRNA synthetase associated domain-containing protein n=1 Tax=Chitinophaga qingshengii TaxID=1569794 RepID=A0ABR7TKJ8_9BACT|nr:YbaK/EbsC family protein [Chitinophaga qingshengii]MBC9930012.1 prolyl-tRNA synthetase associated domain-containing protein [Chitinophaga qingshengii]
MFYTSEVRHTPPAEFKTPLQEMVYTLLQEQKVSFERVDTDAAITMEDCIRINQRLNMKTVKTLFLCNRQQTHFYLFVTTAEKPFKTKDLSSVLGIARLSFASVELLDKLLGTAVGAATIFGVLLDPENKIQVVIDKEVLSETWYGCSDGTTTSYMKISTAWVIDDFLTYAGHEPKIIEI